MKISKNSLSLVALLLAPSAFFIYGCKPSEPTGAPTAGISEAKTATPRTEVDDKCDTYTGQADDLAAKDNLIDAVAMYKEALKLRPNHLKANTNLGSTLMRLERYDEALPFFTKALHDAPNLTAAHLNMANILILRDNLPTAIKHLETALKNAPATPEVHRDLGFAYYQTSRFKESVEHYEKLIALQPADIDALVQLATAQLAIGEPKLAVENLQKAIDSPTPPLNAYTNLAWVCAMHRDDTIRDPKKAIAIAEKAISLTAPEHLPGILRILAAAHSSAGDKPAAMMAIQRAITTAEEAKDTEAKDRLLMDYLDLDAGKPLRN